MKLSSPKNYVYPLLAIILLTSCSPSINVTATDSICKKSVEVHLIGINRLEKDRWETTSMSDYWAPGNILRESTVGQPYMRVVRFGESQSCSVVIKGNDPIRKIWKNKQAEHLVVLADLLGTFDDLPGNADARRLRLPIKDKCWKGDIEISIEPGNIVALKMPKAKCD